MDLSNWYGWTDQLLNLINHEPLCSCSKFACIWRLWLRLDIFTNTWATTRQNQQNECVYSENSDQPGHPPSLIRVSSDLMKKAWVLSYPLNAQRRLGSESLGAHSFCWFWHVVAHFRLFFSQINAVLVMKRAVYLNSFASRGSDADLIPDKFWIWDHLEAIIRLFFCYL